MPTWMITGFLLCVLSPESTSQNFRDGMKKNNTEMSTLNLESMEEKKMQPNSEKTHQMEENPLQRWFVRKPRMNLRAVPPTGESPSELSEGDVSLNLETSYSVPSHRCYVCTHCDSMDPTSTTIEGGCTECVVSCTVK